MKSALYISSNVFAACGLRLIGIGITPFQSLTNLYKYLSQFADMDHQAQISFNTVLIIGGVMIVVGIVQIIVAACTRAQQTKPLGKDLHPGFRYRSSLVLAVPKASPGSAGGRNSFRRKGSSGP